MPTNTPTYPAIVTYGGKTYLGYFDSDSKKISGAMRMGGTVDVTKYLSHELTGKLADVEILGGEIMIKSISDVRKNEFDAARAKLEIAERVAVNKLIAKEAFGG